MFNWFRRQFGKDAPPESVTPEVAENEVVDSKELQEAPEGRGGAETIAAEETLASSDDDPELSSSPDLAATTQDNETESPDSNDYLNWSH